MSGKHAALPPSSAEQWGNCSGWYQATLNAPNIDTPESQEGTAAHWLGALLLDSCRIEGDPQAFCHEYINHTDPDGTVIDDKIAEGAQVYVDDVLAVCAKYNAIESLMVEQRVQSSYIHEQHNWGTFDAALFVMNPNGTGSLYIWDYKHGHREVTAQGNLQLINYAQGIAEKFNITGDQDQYIKVHIRVVQPFAYHADGPVDEWVATLSDLRGYVNKLKDKAHEVFSNPMLSSGKHCRDCQAVGKCQAARQHVYNLIDVVNRPYAMDEMTGADLAVERQIIADGLVVAKARGDAIEAELIHKVSSGDTSTGLALKTTEGRLQWTVNPDVAAALASQFGVDITKKAVLTPTQSVKAIPAKMRPNYLQVLPTMTSRPAGKMKLVSADKSITAKAFKPKQEGN